MPDRESISHSPPPQQATTPAQQVDQSSDVDLMVAQRFVPVPRLVSNLPVATLVGSICSISDGDASLGFGATVVNSGMGATPYLTWWNGTNWTVIGI